MTTTIDKLEDDQRRLIVGQRVYSVVAMSSVIESEIDFTKYRRPELAENLASILSFSDKLRTVLKCIGYALIALWLLVIFLFSGLLAWHWLLGVLLYGTFCAIVTGGLAGVVIVIDSSLASLVKVADITFEISEQVSEDVTRIRGGNKKMPSPRQIVDGVLNVVVLPVLEGVVRGQLPVMGRPLFPLLRWGLRRAIERTLSPDSPDDSPNFGTRFAPSP